MCIRDRGYPHAGIWEHKEEAVRELVERERNQNFPEIYQEYVNLAASKYGVIIEPEAKTGRNQKMGYMEHHALLITTWSSEDFDALCHAAAQIFTEDQILTSKAAINGYR